MCRSHLAPRALRLPCVHALLSRPCAAAQTHAHSESSEMKRNSDEAENDEGNVPGAADAASSSKLPMTHKDHLASIAFSSVDSLPSTLKGMQIAIAGPLICARQHTCLHERASNRASSVQVRAAPSRD